MDKIPIPEDFRKFDSGQQFTECIQCERNLLDPEVTYMIERSIRRYAGMSAKDIVYEYAMCMECAIRQKDQLSAESLTNLESYFKGSLSLEKMQSSYNLDTADGYCVVHGTSIDDMSEYVIQATCTGDSLDPSIKPLVFGEKAMSEMDDLISAKTRDEMDDFIDRHFSGPPEWREFLRNKPVLI